MRNPGSRLLLVVGLLACESTSSPVPVFQHDVTPEMVAGAALAALKPDGYFQIDHPPTAAGDVSLEEARAQAPEARPRRRIGTAGGGLVSPDSRVSLVLVTPSTTGVTVVTEEDRIEWSLP